jgi:hypothetical protein
MPLVRMIVKLSGTRDGAEWPAPGELLECPAGEAAQLVGSALAVPFADTPAPVESAAVRSGAETADVKRAPVRTRKPNSEATS